MSSLHKEMIGRRMPPIPDSGEPRAAQRTTRSRHDYTPLNWDKFFDSKRDLKIDDDSFRVYLKNLSEDQTSEESELPLIVLLHGGGYSGLTFGPFVQEIDELCECRLMAIDFRGHGNTFTANDDDLSAPTLVNDVFRIIANLFAIDSVPPVVLMGHSMGGAIAVHCAATLHELMPRIVGLIVIDVVEGTALDALHSMQSFLRSRPSKFPTMQNAIEWCVRSGQTRNVEAARLSMPGQLKNIVTGQTATAEIESEPQTLPSTTMSTPESNSLLLDSVSEVDDEDNPEKEANNESDTFKVPTGSGYTWRTDLFRSEPYWNQWFQDLSSMFMSCRSDAKLLLLAGVDRLDRTLTLGQMQGKFQMQVLPKCGHTVHEDVPDKVAQVVATFLIRNRFTKSKRDFERPFPSC